MILGFKLSQVALFLQFIAAIFMCADYWLSPDRLKRYNEQLKSHRKIKEIIKQSWEELIYTFKKFDPIPPYFIKSVALIIVFVLLWTIIGQSGLWSCLLFIPISVLVLGILITAYRLVCNAIVAVWRLLIKFLTSAHKGALFGIGAGFLILSFIVRFFIEFM